MKAPDERAVEVKRTGLRGSFWPSRDEEMLLRACLLEGNGARSAWRSVESEFDIDRASGEVLRLLPLLGSNLRLHEIDTPMLPRLRGLHRKSWLLNHLLMAHTAEIVRHLDEDGIPSIVLKGCAIGLGYYGDLGLRPMGDIDLMVRPADIGAAVERLTSDGWTDYTERKPGGTVFRHAHTYSLWRGGDVGCDLHWMIGEHMLLGPGEDPTPLFWPAARRLEVAGVPTLALSPTDQLLHVILHGAQPQNASRLQWIADATMILRSAEIDWNRFEELAIRVRDTIRISDALAYLNDPFARGVPAGSVARLRAHPVSRFDRLEYALASRDVGTGVGMFPATFATYVRETRGWSLGRRTRLFPTFLQEVWELDRLAEVPGTAVRKAVATLRGRRP
jgi:Uncharacterised nucleotidyltransferase